MKEFTDQNFEQEVAKYQGLAVVDCWAVWCGPCRALAPHFEALAEEYADKAKFGKVDIDANVAVAAQYGIMSIPTVLFFKDGQLVDKHVGSTTKQTLAAKLSALL